MGKQIKLSTLWRSEQRITTDEMRWDILRAERNRRLSACDWTQVADAPLTPAQVTGWQVYRQALRDLPGETADPAQVVWPAPPAG